MGEVEVEVGVGRTPVRTVRIATRTCGRTLPALCTPWFVATLVLAMMCASCQSLPDTSPGDCLIEGPLHLAPRKLNQLQLGLSKSSVDRIMGAPAYSPTAGQYYYPTGGECPLGGLADQLSAPCGLVADFLVQDADDPSQMVETGKLDRCWWGAIVHGFSRVRSGE
jgi:hypothetical protein